MSKRALTATTHHFHGAYYWRPNRRDISLAVLFNLPPDRLPSFPHNLFCKIRSFFLLRNAHKLILKKEIQIGKYAELVAQAYLVAQGLKPIEHNWRAKCGELDLIMANGKNLVFVEVKSRLFYSGVLQLGSLKTSRPHKYKASLFDNICAKKRSKVKALANLYLALHFGRRWPQARVDLIGVKLTSNSNSICVEEIQHIVSAI